MRYPGGSVSDALTVLAFGCAKQFGVSPMTVQNVAN